MSSVETHLQAFCRQHPVRVVSCDQVQITLSAPYPLPGQAIDRLALACGRAITLELASCSAQTVPTFPNPMPQGQAPFHLGEATSSSVDDCQRLLVQVINARASDLHIEPSAESARIRLRIDGVLYVISELASQRCISIQSRFKLLAGADIAESRRPQDGQLDFTHQEKIFSFRLATLPTRYGEKLVLRLLQSFQGELCLENLGMPADDLQRFKAALAAPQGLILVTGPTGSGKTATLYSALNALNTPTRNLSSVEDPVEISLPGVNQTQINLKAGLDFALILRALLRQDPDIIMIGEIRDNQTADIAIKAAQTGHLVLSTLHTNSTTDTLYRLSQMGIANDLLASCLQLIIAQRLVRRLCTLCRSRAPSALQFSAEQPPIGHWLAVGCSACFSGYLGRYAIFELLPINREVHHALLTLSAGSDRPARIRQQVRVTLFAAAIAAVDQGLTSYNEVIRVLGLDDEAP